MDCLHCGAVEFPYNAQPNEGGKAGRRRGEGALKMLLKWRGAAGQIEVGATIKVPSSVGHQASSQSLSTLFSTTLVAFGKSYSLIGQFPSDSRPRSLVG